MQLFDSFNKFWKMIIILVIFISTFSYLFSIMTEMNYRSEVITQLKQQNKALINILNECSKCYSSEF